MKGNIIIAFLLLTGYHSHSQNSTVESYIQLGIKNNLSIQQQNLNLKNAFYSLKVARGLFYPTLSFNADYTYSSGGRNIKLPLGDLMNPVFNTLNQLTNSNNFSNIPNQEFNLSANDFYDNKLSLTLPLVDAEIFLNNKIKKEAINQRQAEVLVYKRGLVRDIKVAYYNIAMVQSQIEIFKNAGKLLEDNYILTASRVKNGKLLQGNALRIKSDINDNNAKLAEAQNNLKTAFAYLNFLVNKSLTETVAIDTTGFRQASTIRLEQANLTSEREELIALESSIKQSGYTIDLKRAAYLPVITTFLNGGYQSTYLKFDTESRYLLGGFSLKWNLFQGFQNKNKIAIARTDMLSLHTQLDENRKQFEYQRIDSENDLSSAESQLKSSSENLLFLEEYYRETKARYDQGMVLLIELNDAFTQLINGRLKHEQSNTTVLIKKAELERNTASYTFNQ